MSIALVLLVRSRVNRVPLSLWLDGVVVGLGAATVAAVVRAPVLVPVLGEVFAQTPINLAYLVADLLLLALVVGAIHCFGGGRRRHCGGLPAACWCLGSSIAPT